MFRSLFKTKKRGAIVLAVVVALLAATAAYAAWTAMGTGSASGKTGSLPTITVTAAATPVADESCVPSPSFTCDVSVEVSTGGKSGYHAQEYSYGPSPITSSNIAACPSSNFSLDSTKYSTAIPIAAQTPIAASGTTTVVLPDVVKLNSNAPNGCAGVGFTMQTLQVVVATS